MYFLKLQVHTTAKAVKLCSPFKKFNHSHTLPVTTPSKRDIKVGVTLERIGLHQKSCFWIRHWGNYIWPASPTVRWKQNEQTETINTW